MMALCSRLRGEGGFAIATILIIIGVASAAIVGGSKTAASVLDQQDTHEAAVQLRSVAKVIQTHGMDIGGTEGNALRARGRQMIKIADAMADRAIDAVVDDVAGNLGDAVTLPLQGGRVIELVKFAWDVKGNIELGDAALKAWGIRDAAVDPAIAELQALNPQTDFGQPVEQAVVEVKITATRNAIDTIDTGLPPAETDAIIVPTLIDLETDGIEAPADTDPYSNPFWVEATEYLGAPPPTGTTITTTTTTSTSTPTTVTTTTLGPILEPSDYMDLWVDFTPYDGGATVEWRITNLSVDTIYQIYFSAPPPGPGVPEGDVLEPGKAISGWFEIAIDEGTSWRFTTDVRGELSDGTFVYSNLVDVAVHGT